MLEELNLEKFSPTKSEIALMVQECKDLTINGVDDVEGYKKVHKKRIELKMVRVKIQSTGKTLRADAIAYQKAVIGKEKESTS